MKAILVLASLAMAPDAADSTNLVKANTYNCNGEGGINAILDTSSLTGEPRLYLTGGDIQTDLLSETKLERTVMGHQASVSVKFLSDASIDYTFIVAEVMTSLGQKQDVTGILIKTTAGGLIDPEMVPGPIQSNSILQLSCKAGFVIF